MRAKLYLLRGDGSSVHIDYPDEKGIPSGGTDRAKAMNAANRCYYQFGRRALINRNLVQSSAL
jgi:hypothetical protein